MIIKAPTKVVKPIRLFGESEGFYTFEVVKTDCFGAPLEHTARKVAEFPNLITDLGLELMGQSANWLDVCVVGTGNAAPDFEDTQLSNQVGGPLSSTGTQHGNATGTPYYAWVRRTWTSAVGGVAGNITEIGVGFSATSLFSRALVVDGSGDPTAITVLPDEQLRVTYEHRYYPPLEDINGTFELQGGLGGMYSFIGRACQVTLNYATSGTGWTALGSQADSGSPTWARVYPGDIGLITGIPAGSSQGLTLGGVTGSGLSRQFTVTAGLAQGNVPTGIRSIQKQMGMGCYQFQIDPPIPKTSSDTLALTFAHTWGRR